MALAVSVHGVNFVPNPSEAYWSNLDHWVDNSSGAYLPSANFPTLSDTVLMNGGRVLNVDTNAFANFIVNPNAANSSSTLNLDNNAAGYTLTANDIRIGIISQANSQGYAYQSDGTVMAGTVNVYGAGTGSGSYNLMGGTLTATTLSVGTSVASSTGTSTFMQSGGTNFIASLSIGGTGSGSYALSGGTLDVSGVLYLNTNGRLMISGRAGSISAGSINTQPGGELAFALDGSGVSTVHVGGGMSLADAAISVDGAAFSGGATNFVLMESANLVSMASPGNMTITGLADASITQVDNDVVLEVVESQAPVYFENTVGDGLWGTAGNWSSASVPSGTVSAVIDDGLTATIVSNVPAVNAVTVDGNATLVIRSELSVIAFHLGSQGTLRFDLGLLGIAPIMLGANPQFDPAGQIVIDGTDYEGFDGYFPLILSTSLTGSLTNHVTFTGFGVREPAVVVQDDGLWLRLVAPPSFSQRLCSMVPDSTVAADYSNSTFTATRALQPTVSAWTPTFNEAHVQDTTLSQAVDGSSTRTWELRTARGGHLYSLHTPALGETVPPSYRSDTNSSPWNDEVWQGVAVSPLNDPPDSRYFMHQSGVYLKDPIQTEPFYSPQVAAHIDVENRSFTTVNWTPQAHVNIYTDGNPDNDWKSYLLMFTRYRDLGQGVIEVSLGMYNYGPDELNFLNMPWGGVRRTSTEYAFLSEPGGATWSAYRTEGWGVTTNFNLTGGWMGYSATHDGSTPALALVYGQDHAVPLPEQRKANSTFRWGYAGSKDSYQTGEADWRNYFVTSIIRWYYLNEGHGVWSRYYFVLGDDMQDLSDRIASRNLVDAQLSAFDYTETASPLVAYSVSGSGAGFRVQENGSSPDFFLYAHPVSSSVPIFEVIEGDETRYLTWNPYANGMVKPYDSNSLAGLRLLGFAMPATGANGTYAALAGMLPAENYFADGKTLFVRTATPIETWRVDYFGVTDDAGDGSNTANPDYDTLNNLYEYGLGGDPTNGADVGYVPTAGTLAEGGTNWFEFTHARRIGSESELDYMLETSSNLLSNDWTVGTYIELPATGILDADFESVTNRIDTAGKTNEFIRLKIEAI